MRAGNEAAQRLCARFGFVVQGVLRHRWRLPDGTPRDDLAMARFLFNR